MARLCSEDPTVTVVIPMYNCRKFISDALDSVFRQTLKRFEIIVVDDASTDGSAEAVLKYHDPRVRLIAHSQNKGQAHALNTALGAVRTPCFCQLDGDDWLEPEALDMLQAYIEREPENVGLIAANYRVWYPIPRRRPTKKQEDSPTPPETTLPLPVLARNFRPGWQPRANPNRRTFPRYVASRSQLFALGGARAPRFYRTSAAMAAGGWTVDDPSSGRLLEDYMMVLKMLDHGYRLRWIDATLYNRRNHNKNLSRLHADEIRRLMKWARSRPVPFGS